MLISNSIRRKIVATLVVVAGFVIFYEATIFDSRFSTRQLAMAPAPTAEATTPTGVEATDGTDPLSIEPVPSLRFGVTAYCKGSTTASGVIPRSGIAAADTELLPVGSVIQLGSLGPRYNGVYTIMDTGPKVLGHNLDIYLWSCNEALKFGRRRATVVVLRLGWNPRNTEPTLFDRLLDWSRRAR